MRPERRGACRSEGLITGEHVPDRFGDLAGDVDLGDLRAALFAEPPLVAFVAVTVGSWLAGVNGCLESARRRYRGPAWVRGPRRSLPPDWYTCGHSPA